MAYLDSDINLSQRMTQELGRTIVGRKQGTESALLTEAELCQQFGVSRSAVREAVKMLSAKGLVSSRQRQGIRVLPEDQWNIFDPDVLNWFLQREQTLHAVQEFFQLRIAIEPQAAALAARYASDEEIQAIEAALDGMKLLPEVTEEALQADIAFHVSILYASKNRFYIRLRDFISTALNVSIRYTGPLKADHQSVLDDHSKVFNAIKSRNPERASNAMFLLIDDALATIEAAIEKENHGDVKDSAPKVETA